MGPKPVSTVLTAAEEAIAVPFRQHTLLPLDDCSYALPATIPRLSRSALHRCFQRHGISQQALRQRGRALGLSDAQASALLGFGINQYRTYKNTDKLPSKSNARLLQMLCDDRALVALMEAAGSTLTAATKRKLLAYAAQHQMAALATSANLTATVDIAAIHDDFGQLATCRGEDLLLAGDYGYAMAA